MNPIVRWGVYLVAGVGGAWLLPGESFDGVVPWFGVFLFFAAGYWLGATYKEST